jgi:hypothetical protein
VEETVEFRIPEEDARKVLRPEEGRVLDDSVRVVEVSSDDEIFKRIGQAQRVARSAGSAFFTSWVAKRSYSSQELDQAEVLKLEISRVFEPAGEECGTRYRDVEACSRCGAGARQVGFLRLDLRRLPKRADIARSIADEWVVSQRLAEVLLDNRLSGFELLPVLHRGSPDEPFDLESTPDGRRLLERAEAQGITAGSWEFWVWINREENARAVEAARLESAADASTSDLQQLPVWHQLVVNAAPVPVAAETSFGINVFEHDREGRFRCPESHVAGLNVLSEVHLRRADWPGTDLAVSRELVGVRRGLLRPTPLLLINQRARQVLMEKGIKGYALEVARVSDD